jgi:hypothetical protein
MAGNNAAFVPLGSFNLDDLPDVALDDPNDEFMQYLETLDIPAPNEALGDWLFADVISAGSHAEPARSAQKRAASRKSGDASKSFGSGGESPHSTQDDKLTKMREKNRQAQARFRKRQKVIFPTHQALRSGFVISLLPLRLERTRTQSARMRLRAVGSGAPAFEVMHRCNGPHRP